MKSFACLILFLGFNLGMLAAPVSPATNSAIKSRQATNLVSTNATGRLVARNVEWLKYFQLKHGFYMETLATELLVTNPVAMTFDANGRLYVLELQPNVLSNQVAQGRVRLLEDSDGDGIFNSSIVFAEGLPNPTSFICYDGGVFVGAGSQIFYLKDSKGAGRADIRQEIFKGFQGTASTSSGPGMFTAMTWGLDNRIHVSTPGTGGNFISGTSPVQSIVLTNGNFSFDPRSYLLAVENGNGPSGMAMDDRGRTFVCGPGAPLSMVMYSSRYDARDKADMPDSLFALSKTATAELIYPPFFESTSNLLEAVKPIFPFATKPVPLVSPASLMIYRGSAFPAEYVGDAFTLDKDTGAIHHEKLRPHGIEMIAERPADEQGYEFLTPRNGWFAPAQIVNAPDGSIYLCGSIRKTPVAPVGSTNAVVSDAPTLGRIYRIVPDNFKQPVAPKLSLAENDRLVMMFRHPNGWYRDTAARLLYERQEKAEIVPLVKSLFEFQSLPLSRMTALCVLDGIHVNLEGRPGKALSETHVVKAMIDGDDRVREQGVRLAEQFIGKKGEVSDPLWTRLVGLTGDASPQVRFQLAFTLGDVRRPGRAQLLTQLAMFEPDNSWIQSAILSSVHDDASMMFESLAGDGSFGTHKSGEYFLQALLEMVGEKNDPAEINRALHDIQNVSDARLQFNLLRSLDNSLERANTSLAARDADLLAKPIYDRALNVAIDASADEASRIAAMRLLSISPIFYTNLSIIFGPQWSSMSANLRTETLQMFFSIVEYKQALLVDLQSGVIPRSYLSSVQVRMLLTDHNPDLRQSALNILGNVVGAYYMPPRAQVLGQYAGVSQMTGDATRGRTLYQAYCAACHQFSSSKMNLRVVLTGALKDSREILLTDILDPNHAVPTQAATVIETLRGERVLGFIADQTPTCFKLLTASGVERDIARSNIHSQDMLGVSIMPEGMESALNRQNMADLLEYLTSQR